MRGTVILTALAVVVAGALSTLAQKGPAPPQMPGYLGDGVTLLPNGWKIAPEGRHIQVGDLPMSMVASPDGRFVAITTSGYDKPALSIFDTGSERKTWPPFALMAVSIAPISAEWPGIG